MLVLIRGVWSFENGSGRLIGDDLRIISSGVSGVAAGAFQTGEKTGRDGPASEPELAVGTGLLTDRSGS